MASLKKRGKKYVVVYDYKDGQGVRQQKWRYFPTKDEALKFKAKIEYAKSREKMITPSDQTVGDFLLMWTDLYGKSHWGYSMCSYALIIIRNYVIPEIGDIPLQKLQPIHIKVLYDHLLSKKCGGSKRYVDDEKDIPCLSSTSIRRVHNLLKCAFNKAIEWGLIEKHPVICSALKENEVERNIWSPEMMRMALNDIQQPLLHLAVHLAFISSLRIGEVLGLTWDDVDFEHNLIHIRQILQRVQKESLEMLPRDNLIKEFPIKLPQAKSVLVLKNPKTKKSKRIVYITRELSAELMARKQAIEKEKSILGGEYSDFNLVFALEDGYPLEPRLCKRWFKKWQSQTKLDLPPLVFHELRHSSATYKLLESEGDIKLVQGDLGHSTAKMTVDTYAHTQDQRRRDLTEKIEQDFYTESGQEVEEKSDTFLQLLKVNPELKKEFLLKLLTDT